MNHFICPVCKNELERINNTYQCSQKHSFDISKSGYVNLLLTNQLNSKAPGDNKIMVDARKSFLSKNYYKELSDCVSQQVLSIINTSNKDTFTILDAGCGEGYYTSNISEFLKINNITPQIIGIDISKTALNIAAKQDKDVCYCVTSIFHIPIKDNHCDLVLNLFAPYCGEEFLRVLNPNGIMILVIPGENHLWEFKKAIYDQPYKNEVKDYTLDGFDFIDKKAVKNTINLNNQEDINNLFKMTPYYYKTSEENAKRVLELKILSTQIDFEILVYKKSS